MSDARYVLFTLVKLIDATFVIAFIVLGGIRWLIG